MEEKPSLIDKQDLIKGLLQPASQRSRFINYIIDLVFFYILYFGLMFMVGILAELLHFDISILLNEFFIQVITILFMAMYYFVFEVAFGKTIGKMITKTKVVNEDGTKPSVGTLLKRSFSRLIPFDAFSYLKSNPSGWHDTISKTMVVDDISLYDLGNTHTKQKFEGEEEGY